MNSIRPRKRRSKNRRKELRGEIDDLEAKIRAAKDPANLANYELANTFLMPLVTQTDGLVMLNALGLLKVSQIGVRMHDTLVVQIPAPDPRQHDQQVADQGQNALSDDARPRQTGRLEPLKGKRRAVQQRQFAHKSHYKSAIVSAVTKAPRKDMSPAEVSAMREARLHLAILAGPIWNNASAQQICRNLDSLSQMNGQALKDATSDLSSDQLRKIRVRATQLNVIAGSAGKPSGETIRQRKQLIMMTVAACNDRLLAKNYGSEFLGPESKTEEAEDVGRTAAEYAFGDWLIAPSRKLVTALAARVGRVTKSWP